MSKGLEALKRIKLVYESTDIPIIEKELKALEIIKEKKVDVDLFFTVLEDKNQDDKLYAYNFGVKIIH